MLRLGCALATLLFLIGVGIIGCGDDTTEPEKLTNRVYLPEAIEVAPGESFSISVNFDNEVALAAINVPLTYPSSFLTLDSVSFLGSRAINFMFKEVYSKADTLVIGVIDDTAAVASGKGLLATIYFEVDADAPDTTFLLDTLDYPRLPLSFYDLQLELVGSAPTFRACEVTVQE